MSSRDTTAYAKNIPVRGNVTSGMDRILNKPRISVYRSTTESFANSTSTAVTWDTIDYESDGMWSLANPTRITAHTAGVYAFEAWVGWVANTGGYRHIYFNKTTPSSGATTFYSQRTQDMATVVATCIGTSAHIPLDAEDYVEVIVDQSSGAPLSINAASEAARENAFQACLIST